MREGGEKAQTEDRENGGGEAGLERRQQQQLTRCEKPFPFLLHDPSPGIHDHRQGQRSSSTLPRAGQPSSPSTCRVHGHRDRRSYTSLASSSATFRPPGGRAIVRDGECNQGAEGAGGHFPTPIYPFLLLCLFFSSKGAKQKSYCWCRGADDGNMVGCDGCFDWFHADCIETRMGLGEIEPIHRS